MTYITPNSVRLTSLAVDKFVAGIINEAKQISLLRAQALKSKAKRKALEDTLDLDTLERSLALQKIHIKRRRVISNPVLDPQSSGSAAASSSSSTIAVTSSTTV